MPSEPFLQGYMAAIRASLGVSDDTPFSDETLAAILRDCDAGQTMFQSWEPRDGGRRFWRNRQDGLLFSDTFPPLRLCLGDDGCISTIEQALLPLKGVAYREWVSE